MVDPRIEKLAKLCVRYSVDLEPKEKVLIGGSKLAFPLIKEIYKECLINDAYPTVIPRLDVQYTFYKHAEKHQLEFVSPFKKFLYENIDVIINVWCQPNPKGLTNVDPKKMKTHRASERELVEIFHNRVEEGELKWTLLPYPINAQAQEAAMSLEEYEDFVYTSCLVDKEDPIGEWKKIHKKQEKICDFLDPVEEIHVIGKDTDLTLNVKGRNWINCSGEKNMPDGEVFTSPVEDSANGTIRFTFPGIYSGREVEDIKLTFEDGKVVEASATKGKELLQQLLTIDGADRIGEAAVGTNFGITRFTKNMLFDEKMGGTLHVALGESLPGTGGKNKSAIHWDILKDMEEGGKIYADNKLFYENGKFLI
ncbi:MAG: aminopeptidase [Thermoproteota archaeon]